MVCNSSARCTYCGGKDNGSGMCNSCDIRMNGRLTAKTERVEADTGEEEAPEFEGSSESPHHRYGDD